MNNDRELMQQALDALELVTARMLDCRDELAERGVRPQTNAKHQTLWDLAFTAYTDSAIPIAETLRARLAQPAQVDCCANCLRLKHEHRGEACPKPYTTVWSAWDYEQPAQQEPVGKFAKFNDGIWKEVTDGSAGQPLYTAPPQREWVGLTKEELAEISEFHFHGAFSGRDFYEDIETRLKEKNT